MIDENIVRNYEISLWTLQDSFIAVLKQSGINSKGQVQDSIETINIDGTQELSFTIPMYLTAPNGTGLNEKIENPIWYNTQNGNLIVNLRKVKLIINKNTKNEAIYEFVINKISERHEKNQLYCDVECEGLAFNELGKIGYKMALSSDDYLNDYNEWFQSPNGEPEPRQTLQYWHKKLGIEYFPQNSINVSPNKWYYDIQMSWNASADSVGRAGNKIYEEEYTTSWGLNAYNEVVPLSFSELKEKERPIEIEESNLYNITQQLAEIFGVFCKYEYGYDENYHIISKKIIYYNNLIEEEKGHMDITYPYHTSNITRESDGTDLVTKMYVRGQENEDNTLNIMDSEINKSKEDYILNFDYLHELKIISEEQYKEIKIYEDSMFIINQQLKDLISQIDILNNKKIDVEADVSLAEKAITSAEEQYSVANKNWTELGGDASTPDGKIKIGGLNPKAVIISESVIGTRYIDIPLLGVDPASIKLYDGVLSYTSSDPYDNCTLIVNYTLEFDDYGNLIRLTNLPSNLSDKLLLLVCEYTPKNYWEKVQKYWAITLANEKEKKQQATEQLESITTELESKIPQYNELLDQKNVLIKDFEKMMGPALREGYWQPEDYFDYNTNHLVNFSAPSSEEKDNVQYYWDQNITKEENNITFNQGNDLRQYLMISLTDNQLKFVQQNYENLSFIYYDEIITNVSPTTEAEKNKLRHSVHLIGGCELGFIFQIDKIKPVLIITDSKLFTIKQLNFLKTNNNSNYNSQLGVVNNTIVDGRIVTTINPAISINSNAYIFGNSSDSDPLLIKRNGVVGIQQDQCLLRIKINFSSLNTYSDTLLIKLGEEKILTQHEDYYITKEYNSTYITIRPEVLFKLGNYSPSLTISYSLSTASDAIYLDALEIAKENAYPKVAYTVDLSIYDPKIVYNIYNKLSKVVHINDVDLKFENVQGYISKIKLDLDHPWKDEIEVKNYKTKFEDLFNSIMASTVDIQKNGYRYSIAAAGFNNDGTLDSEVLTTSFNNNSSIFNNYLNTNFDNIEVINNKLKSIFNEAGLLLSNANNSLLNMQSLSVSNANILSGLYSGIQSGFANGIDYTNNYTLVSGDTVNVSAVRINKDEGIYIGSNKKIILSATNAIRNENGDYIGDPAIERSGANVELSPQRLLMGVSNLINGNNGAIDITSDQIILAVGSNIQELQNDASKEITEDIELSGVQIKKDYIGLAAGSENNRSIVSIKPTDITLGTIGENRTGSYIKIAKEKLELGAKTDLSINTNNFKLQTNYTNNNIIGDTIFSIGSNLQSINSNTNINTLSKNSNVNFLINKTGTFINGAFTVVGTVQNNYYPFFKVENEKMGIFRSSIDTTDLTSNDVEGLLYFENGNLYIKGNIIASSFQLSDSVAIEEFDQLVSSSSLSANVSTINTNVTEITNSIEPITAYGLIGRNIFASGTTVNNINYDIDGYPIQNSKSYGLILGNSSRLPMLIGSNSGITIAGDAETQNGEAIVLNSGGISLRGGIIELISSDNSETSIIKLNEEGINLASTAEINMETGGKFNVSADTGSVSLGDYFSIDNEGNLRCKRITCDFINGKDVSNLQTIMTDDGAKTTYGTGNLIYFEGEIFNIDKLSDEHPTSGLNITLKIKFKYDILPNTNFKLRLQFSNDSHPFSVRTGRITIYNLSSYIGSDLTYTSEPDTYQQVNEQRPHITTQTFNFGGSSFSAGEYQCNIVLDTNTYTSYHLYHLYCNKSYLEIV